MKMFTISGEMDHETVLAFTAFYATLTPEDIYPTIIIDSPGGNASAASAILSIMEDSPYDWVTYCAGNAYSAALMVLAGGAFRSASVRSSMLYHDLWTIIAGSPDDIIKRASADKHTTKQIFKLFAKATNKNATWWKKKAKEQGGDFFFNADEAVEYGVIDCIGFPIVQTKTQIGVMQAK